MRSRDLCPHYKSVPPLETDNSPCIHIFHTHYYIPRIVEKGAIKCDNIWGAAILHNVQFANNVFPNSFFCFDMNNLERCVRGGCELGLGKQGYLPGHYDLGSGVHDLAHGATITSTKLS